MDEYGSKLVIRSQDAFAQLRKIWRVSDAETRKTIEEIASVFDELIGDYDNNLLLAWNDEQAQYREQILSYKA